MDSKGFSWIRSDYVGAGGYAVLPDDAGVAVNTTYGVQAVALDGKVLWQADFGERCLGVVRTPTGDLLASSVHAVHRLADDGRLVDSSKTRHEVAHRPVPWQGGVVLVTLTRIYALDADGGVRWKFRLREALGESVRAVLVLAAMPIGDTLVVGAVDYNTGVGQVLVFEEDGEIRWQSQIGPLTSVFGATNPDAPSEGCFVYTLSGYGRFESRCVTTTGQEKWQLPVGGPGLQLPGGRLAMLVGTNESPAWDNWELRTFTDSGEQLDSRPAFGRACSPPVLGADGALYFSTFLKPLDPAESRIDYTSFGPQPAFLAFDYLMRVKATSHEYRVRHLRAPPRGELEVLHEDTDSVAFGPPVAGEGRVFFVNNKDILAVPIDGSR